MTKVLQIISHSEEETLALAEKIISLLTPDDLLVLTGELGTGKTVFVRGLARGLGIDEMIVNSPSYTIVNEYPGNRPMYHFDLYRLGDSSELIEIGWDDYLNKNGLVVVEWGERADEFLPNRYYKITFSMMNEKEREIVISLIINE